MSGLTVSVVIPLFDKTDFIRRTVTSVLAQTVAPHQIIVVDDGSTDGGAAQLADLPGITLIAQPNAGPGPARNRGVAAARGSLVAFLDGDDLWRPDHLAVLTKLAAEFPEAALLATGFSQHHAREAVDERTPSAGTGPAALYDPLTDRRGVGALWTGAVAVRRKVLLKCGGFGDFVPGEDQELWLRLALQHPVALSPRQTALYFRGTGGLMDRIEATRDKRRLGPFYRLLDAALKDPQLQGRRPVITAFRSRVYRAGIRSLLYRGEPDLANWLTGEADRPERAALGPWRAVMALPNPLLKGLARLWRRGR